MTQENSEPKKSFEQYRAKWATYFRDPEKMRTMSEAQRKEMAADKARCVEAAFGKNLSEHPAYVAARERLMDFAFPELDSVCKVSPHVPGQVPKQEFGGFCCNPHALAERTPEEIAKILGLTADQKEQIARWGCDIQRAERPPREYLQQCGRTQHAGGNLGGPGDAYPPAKIKSIPQFKLIHPVPVRETVTLLPGEEYAPARWTQQPSTELQRQLDAAIKAAEAQKQNQAQRQAPKQGA